MNNLDAFIRRASRWAEKTFNEDGEIEMTWLLEKADGERVVMVTPVCADNPADFGAVKNVIADVVRTFCHEHDVHRFVQITEAWLSNAITEQRCEVVMLHAADGSQQVMATSDIVRPDGGKPYLEKLRVIERCDRIEGRFADILPWRIAGNA